MQLFSVDDDNYKSCMWVGQGATGESSASDLRFGNQGSRLNDPTDPGFPNPALEKSLQPALYPTPKTP